MQPLSILSIDPSTATTGVALVSWDAAGVPTIVSATEFSGIAGSGTSLMARFARINSTRLLMEEWLGKLKFATALPSTFWVAYEEHTGRGAAASEAIAQATGAYMTLFPGRDPIAVNPKTAKRAWSGENYERHEAKIAVVQWVRKEFRLGLADHQDAIADALAVNVAARGLLLQRWRTQAEEERQRATAQRPLFGPGSRGGRTR